MIPVLFQGRGAPEHPRSPKGDPDRPRGGGGHDKPKGGGRPSKPSKPAAHKPARHKPADRKPAQHKPTAHRKTAGRGEVDALWLDDVEFRPLATGGHIQ